MTIDESALTSIEAYFKSPRVHRDVERQGLHLATALRAAWAETEAVRVLASETLDDLVSATKERDEARAQVEWLVAEIRGEANDLCGVTDVGYEGVGVLRERLRAIADRGGRPIKESIATVRARHGLPAVADT